MAPPAAGKRKRGDRNWSGDNSQEGQRPSPHRPGNLPLAQQAGNYNRNQSNHQPQSARRSSRGSRGPPYPPSPSTARAPTSAPLPKSLASPMQENVEKVQTRQVNGVQNTVAPAASSPAPIQFVPLVPTRLVHYSDITDEICQEWESSGRDALLEKATLLRDGDDEIALSILFQELFSSGVSGRLAPEVAGAAIKAIAWPEQDDTTSPESKDAQSSSELSSCQQVLLDTIAILAAETETPLSGFIITLRNCGMSPAHLRQELDVKFLEKLGLVRPTFGRLGVRKTTNLLYRQANFNLLREESEGFAKVMTELYTTSSNDDTVEETVERVTALIGSFDLDVGRALDVVMDVFGALLVKQFRFFVKFLRASPWWSREHLTRREHDALSKLGGLPDWALPSSHRELLENAGESDKSKLVTERDIQFWTRAREVGLKAYFELGRTTLKTEVRPQEEPYREWIHETGTLPPTGNRDAAQLLGFKLRFYSSPAARSKNDTLPENLIYLAALLIKIGFISLADLYPHISKSDEEMKALKEEKTKEKSERDVAARPGRGAKNALLTAGALVDDSVPPSLSRLRDTAPRATASAKEAETDKPVANGEKKDDLPEPADQKVPLLMGLLAIGAIPEALFIIGKFPWIVDLYPELPEYLIRIIRQSLSKVADTVRPLASDSSLQHGKPITEKDLSASSKGHIMLSKPPHQRLLRWALLDKNDRDGADYRYYWDEWLDNVPICQDVDDVFTLCDTLITLVGVKIGQDPALLSTLSRIGKQSIHDDPSESNKARWIELCKRLLVPALSLTKSNPGVVNDVWTFISDFSLETRYRIYQEWTYGRTSRLPDVKTATDLALAETRDTLKRISKTNTRPMAKVLAKIAFSNPHIVIDKALSVIESYDNLSEVFVEGARYFTELTYDVLTWGLITALSRAGRDRMGESGMTTSPWLNAGHVCRPNLQAVSDHEAGSHPSLVGGNASDLILLERVVNSMAGIITDASYNDSQLLAMGGGELLRSQTILQLHDTRHVSQKSAGRLIKSLKEDDLASRLLLAISSQRQACVYNLDDPDAPLKYLANLFDEIQRVFTQYLDLLHSNLSAEEFEAAVPDVCELIVKYKLQPELAFWISRPTLGRKITEWEKTKEEKAAEEKVKKLEAEADVDMADSVVKSATEGETAKVESPASKSSQSPRDADKTKDQVEWNPVLQPIMDSIKSSLPTAVSEIVGLPFYVTFWSLSPYDIFIGHRVYDDEIERYNKLAKVAATSRADMSSTGLRKREANVKELTQVSGRLLAENKKHVMDLQAVRARLNKETQHWFSRWSRDSVKLNVALLEHCFLPRVLLSPVDALCCFKFIKLLHTLGTRNFRTMGIYDAIFNADRLTSLIFLCTSKEADNLGRFLNEILKDLSRWHVDIKLYEKEAWGSQKTLAGFARKLNANGQPETFLDYEDFRRLLFKWHQLLANALGVCLTSNEYMHIRNAISILKAVIGNFPRCNMHGEKLMKTIAVLTKSEQSDIKVPSLSLTGDFNKAAKSWILVQAFRIGQEKPTESSAAVAGKDAVSVSGSQLNPTASEFKTKSTGTTASDKGKDEVTDKVTDDVTVDLGSSMDVDDKRQDSASSGGISLTVDDETPKTSPNTAPSTATAQSSQLSSAAKPSSGVASKAEAPTGPTARNLAPNLPDRPDRTTARASRPGDAPSAARLPDKPSHLENGRDSRDGRPGERGPPGRYAERFQDINHHQPYPRPHDRRPYPPDPARDRERPRSLERDMPPRQPAQDRRGQPSRDSGSAGWDSDRSGRLRNADHPHSRGDDERQRDRPAAGTSMAPPRGPSASTESTGVNPERAALINEGINGASIKGQGEDKSSKHSRPTSPRRDREHEHAPGRGDRREDRGSGTGSRDEREMRPQDRRNVDRTSGSWNPQADRLSRPSDALNRDNRRQSGQPFPPIDMTHGRLNQDDRAPARPADQQDRPEDPNNTPLGPRNRQSAPVITRGRGAPNQQPISVARPVTASTPTTSASDRPAPTGPAAQSHPRGPAAQTQRPKTPADTTATGVHPDRQSLVSPSSEGPSRAAKGPLNTPAVPMNQHIPAGPRGNAPSGAPSGPSPISRGPPPGPQGNGRGNRNALQAVNSTLQQAGQARGRSNGRIPEGPSASQSSVASTASAANQEQRSEGASHDSGRPDLLANRDSQDGGSSRRGQGSSRRDEMSSDKGPQNARKDLIDNTSDAGRRSDRRSGPSRERSPSGEGARGDERAYRDRENPSNDRGRPVEGHSRDRNWEMDHRRDRDMQPPHNNSAAPSHRNARRDGVNTDLPPPAIPDDRNRSRRGYHSESSSMPGPTRGGPPPAPGFRADDRDQTRDRRPPAEREREQREPRDRSDVRDRGLPPARDLRSRESDRDRGARESLPPRKHGRSADEPGPYARTNGDGAGRGGGGGGRVASESKRVRRGG